MTPRFPLAGIALLIVHTTGCRSDVRKPAPVAAPASPVPHAEPSLVPTSDSQQTLAKRAEEVKAHPDDARALARYGSALVEAGELKPGIRMLDRAVRRDPKLTAAWHNLGWAAERQGWLDIAADAYKHVVADRPTLTGEWIKLGYALMVLGRYAEAKEAFERAVRLQPRDSEGLVALASYYYAVFQFDDALAALRQAVAANPRSVAAYANMAAIYLERGKPDEAEEAIRSALRLEPDAPRYHLILGKILARSPRADQRVRAAKELQRALSALRSAEPLSPGQVADTEYTLGALARDRGDSTTAVACWRRAIEQDPLSSEPLRALGHALVQQGGTAATEGRRMLQAYERLQGLRQQERELRQRVETRPEDGAARLRYGTVLMEQGNPPRAVWEFREAVRLRPDDSAARRALTTALHTLGREEILP